MDIKYLKLLKQEDWELKVKTIDIKYLRDTIKCACIFGADGCSYINEDISNLRKHIKKCKFRSHINHMETNYKYNENPILWSYMGTELRTAQSLGVSIIKCYQHGSGKWKTNKSLINKIIIHLLDRFRLRGTFKRSEQNGKIMIYNGKKWLCKDNDNELWKKEILDFKMKSFLPFLETAICEKLRWPDTECIVDHLINEMRDLGYCCKGLVTKILNYDNL